MLRHLLKLAWNRKRRNLLLAAEIFFTFLVLFAVLAVGGRLASNYRRPLGYSTAGVWRVAIDMKQSSDDEWSDEQVVRLRLLLEAAGAIDGVAAAAGAMFSPYSLGGKVGNWSLGGRDVSIEMNEVTDGLHDVLGLTLVAGRWFEADDDARDWMPVVVNAKLGRELFGGADPVGNSLPRVEGRVEQRVVGVVNDYRNGELASASSYLFERRRVGALGERPPRNLLLRLAPGAGPGIEERVVLTLSRIAPDWSFAVEALDSLRAKYFRLRLIPLLLAGAVVFFLLLMVALGLMGVVWQNVAARTREIGLRRAAGASPGDIHRQLLVELLLVATMGLVPGVILVAHLPVIDPTGLLTLDAVLTGLGLSLISIYALTAICGLYPAAVASRISPSEALRYE